MLMLKLVLFFFLSSLLLAVPNAPSNLNLSPTSDSVTLSWSDNSDDETGYKIFRDGKLIIITAPDITSYVDKNLNPNTNYSYTVKATDDIRGAKKNKGDGGYYPYDDQDAIRGLKFDVDKDFILHSVKVYNKKGESSSRTFTLLDNTGKIVARKTLFVPEGESRLTFDFEIPKGEGYILLADIHKGLYRDSGVNGYPYAIGDVGSVVSANENSTDYYYFFYDWDVEELSNIDEIKSLSDYDFIGSGYGVLSNPSEPSVDKQVPYIPDLTQLDKLDKIYVSPIGNGDKDGRDINNATTLQNIFRLNMDVLKNKLIIALDGDYYIKTILIPRVDNVTLIAKNKGKANLIYDIPEGSRGTDVGTFVFPGQGDTAKRFSIIGFVSFPSDQNYYRIYKGGDSRADKKPDGTDATEAETQEQNQKYYRTFIFYGYGGYVAEKIYLADMEFHHYSTVIYSDHESHDWTVDRCKYHHGNGSYLWYMQGWHHSVINSVMYETDDYVLSIRGHAGVLEDDDWTHLIANNTFGSTLSQHNREKHGMYHIGIYEAEEDPQPSLNILIKNNIFIDSETDAQYSKKAISIGGDNTVIDRVTIKGNYTDKSNILEVDDDKYRNITKVSNHTNILVDEYFFTNEPEGDYSLGENTIVKDKATIESWQPNVDTTGDPRDDKPDVGAYEIK